jgi:hypothetical protein
MVDRLVYRFRLGKHCAYLSTAWAAGLLGYALAEYRMHEGSERAADEAAARTRAVRGEGQELGLVHAVFMSGMMTLFLAAIVVWLVFFPSYGEEDICFVLAGLSTPIWCILCLWAIVINKGFLHEALVSGDFVMRLFFYYMGSFVVSSLFGLMGPWFYVYYFGLEMMAMAAFFGYMLAINDRRREILAR